MTSPGMPGTPGWAARAFPQEAVVAFPRQFARTRRFSLGTVRDVTLSPDGERALFLRTRSGDDPSSSLWIRDDGGERPLADPATLGSATGPATPEEAARRERDRDLSTGITGYATDDAVELAVLAPGGALWAVRTERGDPYALPAAGPVTDPRPSPDGRLIAYVTAGALHVMAADGTGDRRLAGPEAGEEGRVTYGLTDHVSAESLGRGRGFWWAADGSALLVARVDNTHVHRRFLFDPADPEREPRAQYYPRAGTANADVSLHLVRLDGPSAEVDWDRESFEYVVGAGWDAHGPRVTVQSRDQRTLLTLGIDPVSGATRELARQEDEHWVELLPGAYCRTASGDLVVPHEAGETRSLRVGDHVVTPRGLQVSRVLGTDGETVLFAASEDPLETHVWCWSPEDGCVRVSEEPGLHSAVLRGGTVVLDSLTPGGRRVTLLRAGLRAGLRAYAEAGSITCLTEEPSISPRPELLTLGARQLHSALFLPSWYEQGDPDAAPLPVLLAPYGGPGMNLVVRARTWPALVAQWFAENGYAVLITDGRGTPGRGPSWEKAVWGDQFTPVLEDQVDALHAAADVRPCLDTGRVGIQGWSFGGALATAAVLRRPDVFHAAVAGAPSIDPRLYDTHWKERFLGHPDRYPEHYDRCTLSLEAGRLRRPLLLVHGTADDNVALAHTLRMSAELLAAGREHSVLPLSGQSHIVSDPLTAERLLRTQLLFLDKALRR